MVGGVVNNMYRFDNKPKKVYVFENALSSSFTYNEMYQIINT